MSVIIFLLVLSLLILVHEFGHFIAAKRSGVRVYEFALGFPPTLFKKTIRGTEYLINLLPFGGYVRLLGENGEEDIPLQKGATDDTSESENFSKKSPIIKTYILSAGVAMNMILAWVLFSICLMFGYPTATADLSAGDTQYVVSESSMITYVVPDSPAEEAGLIPSDTLLSIKNSEEEREIDSASDLGEFISLSESSEFTLSVLRDKKQINIPVTTSLEVEGAENSRAIGVISADISVLRYPAHLALFEGARWTINATTQTIAGLATLVTDAVRGKGDFSSVSGPIGIVSLVGEAYSIGVLYLLSFTAIISINLAIVNLLPIPALDGGRILFVWIEAIKGSPMTMRSQLIANGIGFALLILLMIVISVNDIRNIFI